MRKITYLLLAFAIACSPSNQEAEIHGIDSSNMDQTASPNDDFYRFANGTWLDNTEIPADEGRWGGFGQLREETNENMLEILDEAIKSGSYEAGTDQKKAADFFSIGMDSLLAEKAGVTPVKDLFDAIDAASSLEELQDVMAELHVYSISPFFNISVFGDLMNSEMNAFYVVSGGMGLPNRDYYTKDDSRSVEIREKYVAHIARMMAIANGEADPSSYMEIANNIMAIENQLALASLTPIEQRDIPRLYNKMTATELAELTPAIDWDKYFESIYVSGVEELIVTEPKFMSEVNVVLNESSLDHIKPYMKWNIINAASG